MPNLETSDRVLLQQGQQSIVGVLAHAKFVFIGIGGRRRIIENPEEYRRVACVALEEVVLLEPETGGNSAQQELAYCSGLIYIGEQ